MTDLTIEIFKEKGGITDISPLIFEKAKDKINDLTFNRIEDKGFNNLSVFQQNVIIKSLNYLIQFYQDNPEMLENGGNISSYSVGDISVSLGGESSSNDALKLFGVPGDVYNCLKQTGLMRRGF